MTGLGMVRLAALFAWCLMAAAARADTQPALAAFTLVNDGGGESAATILSFGQVFRPGVIRPGKPIAILLDGTAAPAQMNAKALWPDGSVRHAVISLQAPAMRRGTRLAGTIVANGEALAAPLKPAPAPDLHVLLTFDGASGGGHADIALTRLAQEQDGKTWLDGPLVREKRYVAAPVNGIQVVFDVRWSAIGTPRVDTIFHNDRSDDADIDLRTYDVDMTWAGQSVYQVRNLAHYAHSVWHKQAGGDRVVPRILPDVALLKAVGAIPNYAEIEPDSREMAKYRATTLDEGAPPLDPSGLTTYMPTTGGRADIGPLPTWSVFYLLDPSRENEKAVMATGDAAGSVPWHVRDDASGGPIRIDMHPDVWLDGRGHAVPGAMARKYYVSHSKWTPDDAHQPSLSYLPYLLTGSQFYRDELAMQAGYVLLAVDPFYRGGADGIVLGSQVRAVAWDLRTLANAAFILPAGDPLQAYFAGRLRANLNAILTRYVHGHELDGAGALSGYVPGPYAVDGAIPPWQQDYLVMVLGWIDAMGFGEARPILHWMSNFTAGRFTSAAQGYDPIYGTPYFLYVREPQTGAFISSWAGAFQRTFDPAHHPVTQLDYPDWGGGYAALARGALATLMTHDPSPRVASAYDFVRDHTGAMTGNYAKDPTFAIVPAASPSGGYVVAGGDAKAP